MTETKVFLESYLLPDKCFFNLGKRKKSPRETSRVSKDGTKHEPFLFPKMIPRSEL